MASADQSILALGASHLSVSTFSGDAANLVLEQVVHQPLNGDPDLKNQWLSSVGVGLSQLSLKASLKTITGIVLPGWTVLTKVLTVARIAGEGQREVVRFEAENALPNGLEGFEWTYAILRDDGFERDVLVQAVSKSFLCGLLEVLKEHAIQPPWIDALISSEWRALQHQYGSEEGASVLLDIGARSVSLVAMTDQELPFIRSFSFGGGLVTEGLAKQLGKSFAEAERMKLDWIQVQGEAVSQDMLNQSSEGFVNRLVNEVQRSLALYRRQGQSGNPARILLTGGASQLPGLADFLERKTGIATTLYDPFRGISSGPNLLATQTSRVGFALPAALGLALGGQGNLLPDSLSSELVLLEKKPWLIAAAALFLLAGLIVGLKYHMQAWDLQSRIATLEAGLAPIESLSQDVKEAHDTYTQLTELTEVKVGLLQRRQYRVAFLADMQE
ncbi:MAG: pilus assembly protein PilM, partial [Verrucomicrobia bacterium]|nr:pilus assembly protein PilM [Verrucomicrobiota bacterium]